MKKFLRTCAWYLWGRRQEREAAMVTLREASKAEFYYRAATAPIVTGRMNGMRKATFLIDEVATQAYLRGQDNAVR